MLFNPSTESDNPKFFTWLAESEAYMADAGAYLADLPALSLFVFFGSGPGDYVL